MNTLAIYGIFHYHNYLRYLDEKDALDRFYCSYKYNYSHRDIGLRAEHFRNFFLPANLGELNNRLGVFDKFRAYTWCHQLLDQLVARSLVPTSVLHVIHHGIFFKTIAKAKRQGTMIVGEAVNSHPLYAHSIINEERKRLGLSVRLEPLITQQRMCREIPSFDYVLVPSDFVKQSYLEAGINEDQIINIPYRCDTARFFRTREDLDTRPFKVIYVAQITPRKGHVYLLEAWKKLGLPNAELVFIGSLSPEMKPVLAPYEDQFTYLGVKPKVEIYKYLNDASVFVIPSLEEGCSIAPLEAMACGIPVIASANAGSGELLEEGVDGFQVGTRDVEAMANRIEQLYQDRNLLAQMGKRAHTKAQHQLTWEKYADELIAAFQAIQGGGAR